MKLLDFLRILGIGNLDELEKQIEEYEEKQEEDAECTK